MVTTRLNTSLNMEVNGIYSTTSGGSGSLDAARRRVEAITMTRDLKNAERVISFVEETLNKNTGVLLLFFLHQNELVLISGAIFPPYRCHRLISCV